MARNYLPPEISLKAAEARRIALAAQGFGERRTAARSAWPRVAATIDRMHLLQLDSVSTLVRAHYLPVFSRIGGYSRATLEKRAFDPHKRDLFEYWAHEASLLPLRLHPLMRWRMARAERRVAPGHFAHEQKKYIEAVRAEVAERGPLTVDALADPGKRGGPWWGWNKGKSALEYLFRTGEITAAGRRGFERVYDLTERALPAEILALQTPAEPDAIRELARLSAGALGIATEVDIRDYFRLPVAEARQAIRELVEAGDLVPAHVEKWSQPAFLAAGAARPAKNAATALVSPFDPIVWHRPRTERLFGFHYRIELYTPAHKRRFGYYVLPFLHRGRLVGRVDLKSDRAAGTLRVHGAFAEKGIDPGAVAVGLAEELRRMAGWLDLKDIAVARRGELAADVARLV